MATIVRWKKERQLTPRVRLIFSYPVGGPYIDVSEYGFAPREVINVTEDRPATKADMARVIDTWLDTYSEDDPARSRDRLVEDIENHWHI